MVTGKYISVIIDWEKTLGPENAVRIFFVAVGQGHCCVIQDDDNVLIVDAGDVYLPLKEKLNNFGIPKFTTVILTHWHKDHYQGFEALKKDFFKEDTKFYAPKHWKINNFFEETKTTCQLL